jgi:ActR/RegA family two-component response regulator
MGRSLLIGKPSETIRSIAHAVTAAGGACERVDGDASAIRRLRREQFDVVITDPETTIDEDLALLDEVRDLSPGVKAIVLAPITTPEEVIAALRARVFVCLSAPHDPQQIALFAARAAADADWRMDIEVLSAQPEWVSLRVNCRALTADRVLSFLDELHSEVPHDLRQDLMAAFREVLLSAMATSKAFNEFKVVEVSAVRTQRTLVFHVRDMVSPYHRRARAHDAAAGVQTTSVMDKSDANQPAIVQAPYASLLTQHIVDELIWSELGNDILLIKHTS